MRRTVWLALSLMLWSAAAQAGPMLSFESGDLRGWTVNVPLGLAESGEMEPTGSARIGSQFDFFPLSSEMGTRLPVDGDYMALLNMGPGRFKPVAGEPLPIYDIFISREFTMHEGDTLSGWAFFYNGDYAPQDQGLVRILDDQGNEIATPWREASGVLEHPEYNIAEGLPPAAVQYGFSTPWTAWEWTALENGTYTLALGVRTHPDAELPSLAGFDAITKTPEPSSLLMMGVGAVALLRHRLSASSRRLNATR